MENPSEVEQVDAEWYAHAKAREMEEIRRKRREYVKGRPELSVRDAVAILVDDGIATGLTMKAAIMELKTRMPKKLVVAVPVAPHSTAQAIGSMVDEFIGLDVPSDGNFRGAIGAYYKDFTQTEDAEVISLLEENAKLFYAT
jgi:predicted phosphoribosyltransferase